MRATSASTTSVAIERRATTVGVTLRRGLGGQERADLVLDDLADLLDVGGELGILGPLAQHDEVDDGDAVDVGGGRVDVARQGEVDERERPTGGRGGDAAGGRRRRRRHRCS